MPLHLETIDVSAELEGCKSVLIVSCPICPPVSLATDTNSPLIEFFKHGIKTGAYEAHLRELRKSLEQRGLKTAVFTSRVPSYAMCIWTSGQLKRLLKRAKGHDAALVMGCESARVTAEETLKGTGCKVVLAMQLVGITNATMKFRPPLTVELENPTRVSANESGDDIPEKEIRKLLRQAAKS